MSNGLAKSNASMLDEDRNSVPKLKESGLISVNEATGIASTELTSESAFSTTNSATSAMLFSPAIRTD